MVNLPIKLKNISLSNHILAIFLFAFLIEIPCYASGQNPFSAAVKVNDKSITYYEISQRALFLEFLNIPGDSNIIARNQLIDDLLKIGAAEEHGLVPNDEKLGLGMAEFASRGNLSSKEFLDKIKQYGISEQTFRDFITTQIAWRQFINSKFGPLSTVTENQLNISLNANSNSNFKVLLSEIILPVQPGEELKAKELAEQISKIRSFEEFSDAARKYSVAPTRRVGGRIKWKELDKLPNIVKPLILGVSIGEVTAPLAIENGIALFQLRGIEELVLKRKPPKTIEYLIYEFPKRDKNLKQSLEVNISHCDDFYSITNKDSRYKLQRETLSPNKIEKKILNFLKNLDENEKIFSSSDDTFKVIMLCKRNEFLPKKPEHLEAFRSSVRNQRLENFAENYLSDLRASANIMEYEP